MNIFLWSMVAVFASGVIGRIIWLATGYHPPRTARTTALDLVLNIGFGVWALILVLNGAGA